MALAYLVTIGEVKDKLMDLCLGCSHLGRHARPYECAVER